MSLDGAERRVAGLGAGASVARRAVAWRLGRGLLRARLLGQREDPLLGFADDPLAIGVGAELVRARDVAASLIDRANQSLAIGAVEGRGPGSLRVALARKRDPATLLGVYAHLLPQSDEVAAERVAAAIHND